MQEKSHLFDRVHLIQFAVTQYKEYSFKNKGINKGKEMVEKSRKGRTRLPPLQRSQQIVDSAMQLFAQRGLIAVNFSHIAEDIAISPATVFHYYTNKNRLIDAILQVIDQKLEQFIHYNTDKEEISLTQNIHQLLHLFIDQFYQPNNHWLTVWFDWSTSQDPELQKHFIKTQERLCHLLTEHFQTRLLSNEENINLETVIALLQGAFYMLYLQYSHNTPRRKIDHAATDFSRLIVIQK